MRSKRVKLIKKYAVRLGLSEKRIKEEYSALPWTERAEFVRRMEEKLGGKR